MAKARPTDWKDPDYTDVFQERTERLKKIREQESWHLLKRYYADGHYVDFIEDWCVTYDPRNSAKGKPTQVPFILFPLQRDFIEWLQKVKLSLDDGLAEKSRDMGLTWCCAAFALCEWLFSPGSKVSFGSRKEDLVDKMGDPDSIIEKVRIMLRYLPTELLPYGYDEGKHARHMKVTNPQNRSLITGEAGDNIGRGGRSTMYFVDEAAFLERPEKIDAALSANTSSRIDVSTPNGKDNPFALKRHSGAVPVFSFHWTDDPRKDNAWYEKECKRIGDPRIIAQELDLDYESSGEETIIRAEWVRSSRSLYQYLRENSLLPRILVSEGIAGLDIGQNKAENTYIARYGPIVKEPEAWVEDDTTNVAYKTREFALQDGVRIVKYDAPGVGKGASSTFKRIQDVRTQGVNTGETASRTMWPDGKKARDKFANVKAEIWWTARDRLRKTHSHWMWITGEGGEEHDIRELLLLPSDRTLGVQLCAPGWKFLTSGKIQIETKEAMAKRGVRSGDRADSLMLTLTPDPPRMRTGRTKGVI